MVNTLSKKQPAINVEEIKPIKVQPSALTNVIHDKTIKAKEKTSRISQLLLDRTVTIDELIEAASTQKEASKASLTEAIEYASKTTPETVNQKAFEFMIRSLKDDAPSVKREAARVIANTAHLFPKQLKGAVANLLSNTEHSGKVVRWSAAIALSKIILLNTPLNKELMPAAEAIVDREADNAVKKIYQQALKGAEK